MDPRTWLRGEENGAKKPYCSPGQEDSELLAEEETRVLRQDIQNNACVTHPRYPASFLAMVRTSAPQAFPEFPAGRVPANKHHLPRLATQSDPSPLQNYGSLPHERKAAWPVTHCHPHQFPSSAPVGLPPQCSPHQASLTYQVSAPHGGGDVSSLPRPGRVRKDGEET